MSNLRCGRAGPRFLRGCASVFDRSPALFGGLGARSVFAFFAGFSDAVSIVSGALGSWVVVELLEVVRVSDIFLSRILHINMRKQPVYLDTFFNELHIVLKQSIGLMGSLPMGI
jgi:hypothetical protein